MVHSIVVGFALSAVGSLEVGSGLGGRVRVMGEEAIARSAASGDSKIATMGLFGFGLSFVTSYFVTAVSPALLLWWLRALRSVGRAHFEVAEGQHLAEFL